MNKLKTLKKKIRRLEARQQKGAKKLAKLKQKLAAAVTATASKTKSKSAPPIKKPGRTPSTSAPTGKTKQPAAVGKTPGIPRKVKRKLNLTPERRAQLATAMRARWAAKRAAATNTRNTASEPGSSSGDSSQLH